MLSLGKHLPLDCIGGVACLRLPLLELDRGDCRLTFIRISAAENHERGLGKQVCSFVIGRAHYSWLTNSRRAHPFAFEDPVSESLIRNGAFDTSVPLPLW
jgi:hypothetical protein